MLVMHKAVFLDRDGVLSKERPDYVKTPDELELLPGIGEPLKRLREKGYLLVVVTNQSAVGRGLTTHDQVAKIHEKLRIELGKLGCSVDGVYYCPHHPDEECYCRKPAPGLILRAAEELSIDISRSWVIGDKELDLIAAERAGCRAVKVPTNAGGLLEAVQLILTTQEPTGGLRS